MGRYTSAKKRAHLKNDLPAEYSRKLSEVIGTEMFGSSGEKANSSLTTIDDGNRAGRYWLHKN